MLANCKYRQHDRHTDRTSMRKIDDAQRRVVAEKAKMSSTRRARPHQREATAA
jgi:hypothetical protein